MSADRDVTRIVKSWLEEGVTALPDRVLDTVLDQVPTTRQRRSWWPPRRLSNMSSNITRFGLIAAVLAVAVIGAAAILRGPSVGPPNATPTPSATEAPTATPIPSVEAFDPCVLMTGAEAAQALNYPALTGEMINGRYCGYNLPGGGAEILVFSYDLTGGARSFAALSSGSLVQVVPGLGDGALWLPSGDLAILKGDALVQITTADPALDLAGRLEAAKAVGAIMVLKM